MDNQQQHLSEQDDRSKENGMSSPQKSTFDAAPPSDPSEIHTAANNSPQAQQLKSYQDIANGSAQVSQLKSLQANINQSAIQRKESSDAPIQRRWASSGQWSDQDRMQFEGNLQADPLSALLFLANSEGLQGETRYLNLFLERRAEYGQIAQQVNQTILTSYQDEGIYTTIHLIKMVEDILTPLFAPDQVETSEVLNEETDVNDDFAEDGHDYAGEAPELIADPWDDVYAEILGPEMFKLVIYNWVLFKGYSVENFESKYYHWLYNGVVTRDGFQQIFNTPQVQGAGVQQHARTPNTVSTQAQYQTKNFGQFQNVSYMRDGLGNIDFSSTYGTVGTWSDPVSHASHINLNHGSKKHRYGLMPSGKLVEIPKASRSQHFAIGDRLVPGNGRQGKWTWHHLSAEYEMVLVDMTVHAKHGHNGGVHIWH